MLFSQIFPPSPSPTVSKSPSFMSVSPLLPCTQDHQYYLYRFHLYALIYNMSFALTFFCIVRSRFIHLIRIDSNALFLF